jgi:hypothetical protein
MGLTQPAEHRIKQDQVLYDITSDGVFTNTGTMQTHRNLETSYKIMREFVDPDDGKKIVVG